MSTPDQAWWIKARAARDKLAPQVMGHPDVSGVDIGLDPTGVSATPVLRVHVKQDSGTDLNLPQEVDGIPVHMIRGDYRPAS